jgi:hypothetical protein
VPNLPDWVEESGLRKRCEIVYHSMSFYKNFKNVELYTFSWKKNANSDGDLDLFTAEDVIYQHLIIDSPPPSPTCFASKRRTQHAAEAVSAPSPINAKDTPVKIIGTTTPRNPQRGAAAGGLRGPLLDLLGQRIISRRLEGWRFSSGRRSTCPK